MASSHAPKPGLFSQLISLKLPSALTMNFKMTLYVPALAPLSTSALIFKFDWTNFIQAACPPVNCGFISTVVNILLFC
jgi:hypothetical protein